MTQHREFEASLEYVRQHYGYNVIDMHDGGMNSVAILSDKNTSSAAPQLVLKVPNGPQKDDEYRALTFLQKELTADQPWSFPKIVEKSNDPPFLLTSYVAGETLEERAPLTTKERQLLGRDIARFAILETQLDVEAFKREVDEPRGGSWRNWDAWFERLDQLSDEKTLPTLTKISQEMVALRKQYYPHLFDQHANQVIHGDLRLPNLALRNENGKRRLSGIFDFGTMRRGDMAEEMRALHLFGKEAIDACNQEFTEQGYPTIAPEKIKFWCVGRWAASLLYQIANGRPNPKEYNTMVQHVMAEYPDADWSELPKS